MDERPPAGPDETLKSRILPESVPCPFCEGEDTEQFSTFGGQASTTQYYCNRCRTVFECFRWRGVGRHE